MRGGRRPFQRTCIGCRRKNDRRGLLRLVRGPDETLTLDLDGRAAGRGLYLCPDERCLKRAGRKKFRTGRGPGTPTEIDGSLHERIRAEIARRTAESEILDGPEVKQIGDG